MTTQEKLIEAAEAALSNCAYRYLKANGLGRIENEMLELVIWDARVRSLYLCLLAAAWDDLHE